MVDGAETRGPLEALQAARDVPRRRQAVRNRRKAKVWNGHIQNVEQVGAAGKCKKVRMWHRGVGRLRSRDGKG